MTPTIAHPGLTNSSPTKTSLANPLVDRSPDQRICFPGTWESFELIQQGMSDRRGVKLSFYDGTIEIFMPGAAHSKFVHIVGYFVTTLLLENGIEFVPSGDKNQAKKGIAGLQADESYCIGPEKDIPDLSIEVVFTSGGPNKLKMYAELGTKEVWFWEDGMLSLYHFRSPEQIYEKITVSELPGLDALNLDLLQRCILRAETDFPGAVLMLRTGN
jgi:Uma2 family endonuclease